MESFEKSVLDCGFLRKCRLQDETDCDTMCYGLCVKSARLADSLLDLAKKKNGQDQMSVLKQ